MITNIYKNRKKYDNYLEIVKHSSGEIINIIKRIILVNSNGVTVIKDESF